MINYARIMALGLPLLVYSTGCIASDDGMPAGPEGEWLVKDATAHIRIVSCDNKFWGVISWEKTPGIDENNPDVSKRNRPVLGLPILLGMQASAANQWDGKIYNADNGKIYEGNISLKSNDMLSVHGCVLYGIVCGSENWTRLATPLNESTQNICQRIKGR